ncbi:MULTISPECIES: hypothetical protein [Aestuariibaculum]|uniref:Uncharacterized protein n=1 Tax=Aestuariibaculum lutulentum TaxID=2920935 RepID=A0ABS9RI04_9FLAO|nr:MULTISPECIES: hypothetical protein [Aestuariibaculum]MCH4552146.1 hypothetical protein [Aestuariibaculum lutulentum]MCR8667239.1 hypothetical protein [Aestuariibaculum sp. M13]
MKNLYFILAFVFVTFSAFSQDRSDLKGPAYKNYKHGKNKTEVKQVYTSDNKANLTGPAYKNYKPGKNTEEATYTQVVFENKKANLTGPAYKNYKPGKTQEVSVIAVNE